VALIRLHKLLAGWGVASRRAVEAMILARRIRVDGEVFTDLGRRVDPAACRIEIDGRPVTPPAANVSVVMVFHKPAGVLSSLGDRFGRPTLADFFPGPERLYPVGRLDSDSTGLLLMTNDGELTNRLLHPRYKVEKEYLVQVAGPPLTAAERARFEHGLDLEDGRTAPCHLRPILRKGAADSPTASPWVRRASPQVPSRDRQARQKRTDASLPRAAALCPPTITYRVILREGRKRQIKRMFAALDRRVVALHRIRFGPIRLGDLPPGRARPLSAEERRALLAAIGREETER
jgi:23S rRNA pseudouridine2605 synthase